ncbi:maleylpyruvate isomerase family mycothiol-dependent enzyme [bacterium]|nr:maleylpyruvate isomerase family mycothiol-dependent enzyme [bacterium]
MREILADLVAEQQALDQMLQRSPDRDWKVKTRLPGWKVQDIISHLASNERLAAEVLEGNEDVVEEALAYGSVDLFNAAGVQEGRALRPQAIIEWWRHQRAAVVDALSRMKADDRVPWIAGDMSAKTFATSRLMETWAHGLDIDEALGKDMEDTPRTRHIAWLGWATLPWAFEQAGEEYSEPIRIELVGPAYARWAFGPEGAANLIKGNGGEWCRVAVRRLDARKTENLTATGPIAEIALQVARTYL